MPRPGNLEDVDLELKDQAIASIGLMRNAVENMKIDRGLEHVMNVVRAANRYMEKTAPWTLAKQGNMERLRRFFTLRPKPCALYRASCFRSCHAK